MSILSPNIILSEKEELEHYLGKKISKNEYNNFYSTVTSLSETISKNPNKFKSFISGIVTETETEKVKSGLAPSAPASGSTALTAPASGSTTLTAPTPGSRALTPRSRALTLGSLTRTSSKTSSKVAEPGSRRLSFDRTSSKTSSKVAESGSRRSSFDRTSSKESEPEQSKTVTNSRFMNSQPPPPPPPQSRASSILGSTSTSSSPRAQPVETSNKPPPPPLRVPPGFQEPYVAAKDLPFPIDAGRTQSRYSFAQSPQQQSVSNSQPVPRGSFLESIRNSSPDKLRKSDNRSPQNKAPIITPKQQSMIEQARKLAEARRKQLTGNDDDDSKEVAEHEWNNKKYYSQTADMEQKYLKYKNKYLSLKQELGI